MPAPLAEIREMLEKDLYGFANPRTRPTVDVVGSSLIASWQQRREARSEMFSVDEDDRLVWIPTQGVALPYRDFLRSRTVADFEQLAEATAFKYQVISNYVAPPAVVEEPDGSASSIHASLAEVGALIRARLDSRPGRTTVYFVKGDAGAGKTTLLQQLVASHAERHGRNLDEARFLFFYVSARGRLLSNLPDALAAETQDLAAAFRNDAVAVLARRRILVPIIDGFDELIGTAGYTDAFASLQGLLGALEGEGVVIVSARSSFYEAEFVQRGHYFDESAYTVIPLSLGPWTDIELVEYLERTSCDRASGYIALLDQLGADDRALLTRPFFASGYPAYAERRMANGHAPPLLSHLIEGYVEREARVVVDATGNPLLPVNRHQQVFEEAAEAMWMNGDRKISEDDLRIIAASVAEEAKLTGSDVEQFETKITSYAGFQRDPRGDSFAFEHEVYFSHFLAQACIRYLASRNLGGFLDRGLLPSSVVAQVVAAVPQEEILTRVRDLSSRAGSHENRRLNAAGFIVAIMRRYGYLRDATIQHVDFVGVDLDAVAIDECSFSDCTFFDVSMRGTRFAGCRAERCTFARLILDDASRLDVRGVDPDAEVTSVIDATTGEETFAPLAVRARLAQAGLQGADASAPPTVDLELGRNGKVVVTVLNRLARRFRRSTLIATDDADEGAAKIFGDRAWPVLLGLLRRHELIREETRSASGPRKLFIRPAVDMQELLERQRRVVLDSTDPLDAFWLDVRALR